MTGTTSECFATVVIVAAGRGERFGLPAKILELVGGRPVLEWSMTAAIEARCVRDVIVVTGEQTAEAIANIIDATAWPKPVSTVPGGVRRQDSVAAGVDAIPADSEVVLIHDGARPLVESTLFETCANEARMYGAAIAAVPVSDTLMHVTDRMIDGAVSRNGVWAAQTPQGFRLDLIRSALERCGTSDVEFTDEASMLETLGEPVHIVQGAATNLKITLRDDLDFVDSLLLRRIQRANETRQ